MLVSAIDTIIRGKDGTSGKLRNPDVTLADVCTVLQDVLTDIADRILLPALYTSATLSTVADQAYCDLPDDFHRKLTMASTDLIACLPVVPTEDFFRVYRDLAETGPSVYVACTHIGAKRLYYQPIPTEVESITIRYFRKPGAVRKDVDGLVTPERATDAISCLPDELIRSVVVPGMLAHFYDDLEDGYEGKPNADRYAAKYKAGIRDVRLWVNKQGGIAHTENRIQGSSV